MSVLYANNLKYHSSRELDCRRIIKCCESKNKPKYRHLCETFRIFGIHFRVPMKSNKHTFGYIKALQNGSNIYANACVASIILIIEIPKQEQILQQTNKHRPGQAFDC